MKKSKMGERSLEKNTVGLDDFRKSILNIDICIFIYICYLFIYGRSCIAKVVLCYNVYEWVI